MKINNYYIKLAVLFVGVLHILFITSCEEETEEPTSNGDDPIASFQFNIDTEDFLKVNFSNFSLNASEYSWDFGDGNSSTDKDPEYTYTEAGTYTVVLTAIAGEKTATRSQSITLTDPNEASKVLTGADGKEWQLLADVSGGMNPIQVGPTDRSQIWWALGVNEQVCVRPCAFNDTWTFNTDGTFTYDNKGDFWGEGGIWPEELIGCFDATDAANFIGADGQDLSAWNSGTHPFEYDASAATLKISGGFIGLCKAGTDAEFTSPQAAVTYKVVKLVDSDVDTLVLETNLVEAGGYWAMTLVSYDNPSDAIVVGDCDPVESVDVTFKLNLNAYEGTAAQPYVSGTFNNWSGDGNPMSDEDGDGIWELTMNLPVGDHEYKFTADNWADQEELTEGTDCTITTDGFTNRKLTVGESNMVVGPYCWNSCDNCPSGFMIEDLVGEWTLAAEAGALKVGPAIASGEWWSIDEAGIADRACYVDDVYTFGDDGSFNIEMDGSTWVETWQGVDADQCAAPVAPHDGSAVYTYEATETTVTVKGKGAFLGLPKATNDAELQSPDEAPEAVTYTVYDFTKSATGQKTLTLVIETGADSGVFWTMKFISK